MKMETWLMVPVPTNSRAWGSPKPLFARIDSEVGPLTGFLGMDLSTRQEYAHIPVEVELHE